MKPFLLLLHITLAGSVYSLQNNHPNKKYEQPNRSFDFLIDTIQSFLGGYGNIRSHLGYLTGRLGKPQEFDYIVVGGGAAGTVMSYRLAEAGYDVALIEAGEYHEYSKPAMPSIPGLGAIVAGASGLKEFRWADWGLFADSQVGDDKRKVHFPQGKGIGGSSFLSYMLYHRAPRSFFDTWADMAGDESYRPDNFEQFYTKSVTVHAQESNKQGNASTSHNIDPPVTEGGPIQVSYPNFTSKWATWFEKALKSAGLNRRPETNGSLMGYHYAQMTIRPGDASKSSAAEYILTAKLKNLARLRVFTSAEATGIFFEKNKATGVYVTHSSQQSLIKATQEVILSAGALKSPQLLMVSGIGPESVLEKYAITSISPLQGVGQNMWDHIYIGPSYPVSLETTDGVLDPVQFSSTFRQYNESGKGPLSSNGLELMAFEKLPQQHRQFSPQARSDLSQIPADWPEVEYLSANGYVGNYQTDLFELFNLTNSATILAAIAAPLSRGNITIQSKDASSPPLITLNWLTSKTDQELAIACFKRARNIFKSPTLQPIRAGEEVWPGEHVQTDEEILSVIHKSFFTAGHPAGTCKMGRRDDNTAVVDNEARVLGVQGLRVVDASSLPLLPPGHPIATIYAFAEKIAASMIRQQLGLK